METTRLRRKSTHVQKILHLPCPLSATISVESNMPSFKNTRLPHTINAFLIQHTGQSTIPAYLNNNYTAFSLPHFKKAFSSAWQLDSIILHRLAFFGLLFILLQLFKTKLFTTSNRPVQHHFKYQNNSEILHRILRITNIHHGARQRSKYGKPQTSSGQSTSKNTSL